MKKVNHGKVVFENNFQTLCRLGVNSQASSVILVANKSFQFQLNLLPSSSNLNLLSLQYLCKVTELGQLYRSVFNFYKYFSNYAFFWKVKHIEALAYKALKMHYWRQKALKACAIKWKWTEPIVLCSIIFLSADELS